MTSLPITHATLTTALGAGTAAQPVAVEMSWIPADSEQGPAENR